MTFHNIAYLCAFNWVYFWCSDVLEVFDSYLHCYELCGFKAYIFFFHFYINIRLRPVFFFPRLVVSSLEALENCYAVGSASEKVSKTWYPDGILRTNREKNIIVIKLVFVLLWVTVHLFRRKAKPLLWRWLLFCCPCLLLLESSSRPKAFWPVCTLAAQLTITTRY